MKPRARLSHCFSFSACVLVCVDTSVGERNTRSQLFSVHLPAFFRVALQFSVSCQADMTDLGEHSIYSLQCAL